METAGAKPMTLQQDNFFLRMQIEDRTAEARAAAPDQTAIQKQEEMASYWREMLYLNGLSNKKAPQSEAESLVNRQLWQKL
jgi:hypothetical protein